MSVWIIGCSEEIKKQYNSLFPENKDVVHDRIKVDIFKSIFSCLLIAFLFYSYLGLDNVLNYLDTRGTSLVCKYEEAMFGWCVFHGVEPENFRYILYILFIFSPFLVVFGSISMIDYSRDFQIKKIFLEEQKERQQAQQSRNLAIRQEQERQEAERRRVANIEAEEQRAYQRQLQEIEDREFAKTRGQSRALMELYKGQLSLLQDHKRRGLDIEQETFELKKNLLRLESEENEKMINDMLRTLDRL